MPKPKVNKNLFPTTQLVVGADYEMLFSVDFMHDYYATGLCSDIRVEPTIQTAATLRNYKLLFKRTESGFVVAYHRPKKTRHLLQIDGAPMRLSFTISSDNKLFHSFSRLPFSRSSVLCLDNAKYQEFRDEYRLLHQTGFAGEQDMALVASPNFSYPLDAPLEDATVEVKDRFGNVIYQQEHVYANETVGINLLQEPRDLYSLFVNGAFTDRFYTHDFFGLPPMGIIDIHIGDHIDRKMTVRADGQLKRRSYVVRFERRETVWKYMIVPPQNNPYDEFTIIDEQSLVTFNPPQDVKARNGLQAMQISTASLIPCMQNGDQRFQLNMKRKGKDIVVTMPLPAASPEHLVPAEVGSGNEYDSEIFIFV